MAQDLDRLSETVRTALHRRQVDATRLDRRATPLEAYEWEMVEAAAADAYRLAGLQPPPVMIRADSPHHAMLAAANALPDEPVPPPRRTPRALVSDAILERPMQAVREVVADSVVAEMLHSTHQSSRSRSQVGETVSTQLSAYLSEEAGWPQAAMAVSALSAAVMQTAASASALLDWVAHDLVGEPSLPGWDLRVAACAGLQAAWSTIWLQNAFIACDRPVAYQCDENDDLHGQHSPALAWGDGWSVSAWHGTPVPDDFYLWDAAAALGQRNAEVRRCAIERLGWPTLLETLTPIDTAPDPGNPGQVLKLYKIPPDWDPTRWLPNLLVVGNASLDKGGARRSFVLKVPPWHRTAIAAAADLFGLEPGEYAQVARAT